MRNLLIHLFLVFYLIFFCISSAFSKVVGDKIILGSVISLTGKYSSKGLDIQKGFNLAINNINNSGGLNVGGKNYNFQIVYYDDESNLKGALQIAKRLILQEGIQFLLGPYSRESTRAILPLAEKNRVILIEINNTPQSKIAEKLQYTFSVMISEDLIKGSTNILSFYKEAIENANSLDVSKIRDSLRIIIQIQTYLFELVS